MIKMNKTQEASRTKSATEAADSGPSGTLTLPRSPRLAKVVRTMAEHIRTGRYEHGHKLPPIRDLAQEHGLSFGSARTAIACLERAGLVQSLQGSGTFVRHEAAVDAPLPATTDAWAVLFTDDRVHVGGNLGGNIARILESAGIRSALATWRHHITDEALLSQCRFPHGQMPRAIVLQGGDIKRDALINELALKHHIRVICLLRLPHVVYPTWHTINPDYHGAYQAAARELIAHGHRRIGVVTKERIISANWVHTVRKNLMIETQGPLAVGKTLREVGVRGGLTIHYNARVNADPSGFPLDEFNMTRMVAWLKKPNRPTAVVTDDYRVAAVIQAARQAGLRVPADLQVVAICGALPHQMFDCPSVSLRYDLLAQRTADLILMDQRILGSSPRHVEVPASWTRTLSR